MNTVWTVFEFTVNIFQGIVMTFFPYAYLGDKNGDKYFKSIGLCFGVITGIVITVMNYFTIFEHVFALAYALTVFIYALVSLKGSIMKKLFASILSILIVLIITAVVSNFACMLFNTSINELFTEYNVERLAAVISDQLIILYCMWVALNLLRKNVSRNGLSYKEWLLILVVLVFSILICALLNLMSLYNSIDTNRKLTALIFLGIVLINVIVFYLVVDLSRINMIIQENKLLKLQREYNKRYIENANTEYDVIRKLRHDSKSNYTVIYTLLCDGKIDAAKKHIEKSVDALSSTEIFVNTNNDAVNAVVNAKLSTAKSLGIDAACLSVSDFSGIDDFDLCRLLSNMIENAITACLDCDGDRLIYLKILSDKYMYTFSLKNTINGSVIEENPNLSTTKSNKAEHGYGTKIIHDVAEKYNGICDFYEEDGLFCCNVVLKKLRNNNFI